MLNLVSSPGTGKTEFLERTLSELLNSGAKAAALVGDLETDNDARRLAASGAPVRQINTHGICHLEAEMIASTSMAGTSPTSTTSSSKTSAISSAPQATISAKRSAWRC